ncbi:unnamed protein product [Bemisia tabaci]|uniref:Uncharacterized protein n=1 Tax=Bemisia tabaci TaxID=7038 RepID=A0A9P0A4T9_BEMTA|nr:unnamed protein product [Bemisia tabaci]
MNAMNAFVYFTLAVGLNFMGTADGTFCIEVGEVSALDDENWRREAPKNPQPEVKPGLYLCEHKMGAGRTVRLECTETNYFDRVTIARTYNFYIASNPRLAQGHKLILGNTDVGAAPEVMIVGFNPKQIDAPKLLTSEFCKENSKEVIEFSFKEILPKKDKDAVAIIDALTEYFCCNDVDQCILKNAKDTIGRLFPAMRRVLSGVLSGDYLKPQVARQPSRQPSKSSKQQSKKPSKHRSRSSQVTPVPSPYAGSTISSHSTPKRTSSQKSTEPEISGMAKLQAVMAVLLNKMIDPCILMRETRDRKLTEEIKNSCKVYCQFLNKVTEVFDQNTSAFCVAGYNTKAPCLAIRDGKCSEGVCTCLHKATPNSKKLEPVSMMFCANSYRVSTSATSQCQRMN